MRKSLVILVALVAAFATVLQLLSTAHAQEDAHAKNAIRFLQAGMAAKAAMDHASSPMQRIELDKTAFANF